MVNACVQYPVTQFLFRVVAIVDNATIFAVCCICLFLKLIIERRGSKKCSQEIGFRVAIPDLLHYDVSHSSPSASKHQSNLLLYPTITVTDTEIPHPLLISFNKLYWRSYACMCANEKRTLWRL
jgi:hypothetical protein